MRKIEKEVGEYLGYCEKVRGMSEATLAMKRDVLGRFVREVEVEEIGQLSNYHLDMWTECGLKRGVRPSSMNTYTAIVVRMIRYYQEMGVLVPVNLNLVRKLKGEPRRRKFYSAEEISHVVDAADVETGLMVRVMFETGMRIAELTRLSTSEIGGPGGRRIDFTGKGRKKREVYMSAETAVDLTRFIGGREGYVWGLAALNGEPPSVNTVRNRLKAAFNSAGIEGFYPHALRHSFATSLQLKGASVEEIKEMMGHSSVATTERYLHGLEGRLEELFSKYQ